MPALSIHIDEATGLALISGSGEVTGADIVDAARALHGHPKWDFRFDVLWDGRAVTSLVVTPDDIPEMVEAKTEHSVGKEVIVAVRSVDKMIADLSALLMRARGREAHAFYTLDEALDVLGLSELPTTLRPEPDGMGVEKAGERDD